MAETERLDVGRVVQRAIAIFHDHPLTVAGLSLAAAAIPMGLELALGLIAPRASPRTLELLGPVILRALGISATGLVAAGVLQGALTASVLSPPANPLSDRLATGRWGVVAMTSLLYAAAFQGGFVLLVLPGLIVATVWLTAPSVSVAERLGPFAALGRASALTRRNRLIILLLVVLYVTLSMVGPYLALRFGLPIRRRAYLASPAIGHVVAFALATIVEAIRMAVGAVGGLAIYLELRRIHDGPASEETAAVFS